MKNLTTPQAILCGLGLIALAIAFSSYVPNSFIREAKADAAWLSNINSSLNKGNQNIVQGLRDISSAISKCN